MDVNHDVAPPDRRPGRAVGPDVSAPPVCGDAAAMAAVVDPAVDSALDALVAAAPPLSYEVRMRLAHLLRHHEPPPGADRSGGASGDERREPTSTGCGVDSAGPEPAADVDGRGGAAGAPW